MFSLFFAGSEFAPATQVSGEPVQEYLQRHYIAAVCRLAERLRDLPHVVGYDTMNEPSRGWLGWQDLRVPGGLVQVGPCPSPFDAMRLAAGESREVDFWEARTTGFKRMGRRLLNPDGERAWLPGHECVWKRNGVWDVAGNGEARLLRPDHFARIGGRPLDFSQDCYLPFAQRFRDAIHAVHPGALIFVESAPQQPPPRWDVPGLVHAPHWYDGFVLMLKRYSGWLAVDNRRQRLVVSPWWIRRSFAAQLRELQRETEAHLPGAPTVIGEFGIPFDLRGSARHDGDSARRRARWTAASRAGRRAARRRALVHVRQHNAHGDQWNGGDLSSSAATSSATRGRPFRRAQARRLRAPVRPCDRGRAAAMHFDRHRRRFELVFRHDPQVAAPTEIFVPAYHYPRGARVEVSDGGFTLISDLQLLEYRHDPARETHTVRLRPWD
jgi:hypothetical protein